MGNQVVNVLFGAMVLVAILAYVCIRAAIRLILWASAAFDSSIPEEENLWQDVDKTDTH